MLLVFVGSIIKKEPLLVNGILNIYKPSGIQSFDIIRRVRRKLQMKKAGYVGTLDNFASGVLLAAAGKATKLIPYILTLPKQYKAKIIFGTATDTLDIQGRILRSEPYEIEPDKLQAAVKEFTGEYWQVPPEFSSKKIKGRRASDLKRAGRTVKLQPALVKIYDLQILNINGSEAELLVSCSSGTYIRSLARDIAEKLGTAAYVSALSRVSNGRFTLESSIDPDDIAEDKLISMRDALYFFDELLIQPASAVKLKYGNELFLEDFNKINLKNGIFKVIFKEQLSAVVKYEDAKFTYLNNFYEE